MSAAEFVQAFSRGIGVLVTVLYAYQVVYLIVGLVQRVRREKRGQPHLRRYAALISARNEAGVIAELIHSLKRQNYPADLLDIYVVADNCTDLTAAVAQAAGARVYRRADHVRVGKGYALDFLLKKLSEDGLDHYDGYLIFDADNLVDPNFVAEMDRTFDPAKHAAVTSYRNSKNFGQNWVSAGYSIWFLREARFVNAARQALGLSCAVSGTGFLISGDFLRAQGGWPYHLLTEDIQFSAHCVSHGLKIGYCPGAVIYDEQPTSLGQSWDQRLRWSKGFYQVAGRYGGLLRYAPHRLPRRAPHRPGGRGQPDGGSELPGCLRPGGQGRPAGLPGLSGPGLRQLLRGHVPLRAHHRAQRVAAHPLPPLAEAHLPCGLPPLHGHLHPHLHRRPLPEGGVEAHPPHRPGRAGPGRVTLPPEKGPAQKGRCS